MKIVTAKVLLDEYISPKTRASKDIEMPVTWNSCIFKLAFVKKKKKVTKSP